MKLITLSVLLAITSMCSFLNAETECYDFSEIQNEILEIEKAALKRWLNRDVYGFLDIFTKDVTYFDEGTKLKLKGIEEVKEYIIPFNGQIYVPEYKMDKVDIKVSGDTAILTYNIFNYNKEGKRTLLWNATEIYIKDQNDSWKITHAHWSIVKTK